MNYKGPACCRVTATDVAASGLGAILLGWSLWEWRGKPAAGIWEEVVCGQCPCRMGEARQSRESCRKLLQASHCHPHPLPPGRRITLVDANECWQDSSHCPCHPPACRQDWELGSLDFLSACKHSSVARWTPITAIWLVFHSLWGTFKTCLI